MRNFQLQPVNNSSQWPWLWIGTWSLGGEGFGAVDLRESRQILARAFEFGLRHFDTAGLYAHGKSETLISDVFKSNRKEIFISTKGGLRWNGNMVQHAADLNSLRQDLEASLKRLQTEYIDLFQLHWPDPNIEIDISIEALKGFQKEGLIKYWGVGNLTPNQIQKHIGSSENIPHQVRFNPIHQDLETLQSGKNENRCLNMVISPLEQGLLGSGQSSKGLLSLGKRDLRHRNKYFNDPQTNLRVQTHQLEAEEKGLTPALHSLLWILKHPEVDAVIPGPKTLNQLEEIIKVPQLVLNQGQTD